MKVKKTDLPIIHTESDILPSIDDVDADNSQDDDDDDLDDDEDMIADDIADSEDDDYDSDEDSDIDRDSDVDEMNDNWDALSTQSSIIKSGGLIKDNIISTTPAGTTPKSIDSLVSSSTVIPTVDPYFTHFDPRNEHQSYKV